MNTAMFYHEAGLDHDTGPGHPERSDRLRAVMAALEDEAFQMLDRRPAPLAELEQIIRVHPEDFVTNLLDRMPQDGHRMVDGDTVMSPGTREAALRSAGAAVAGVDAVFRGEARNAFCAMRPPGHHAERHRAMGFCFFNNAAVAAAHARAVHGIERVAVIDFDVHHGNGTQDIAWSDRDFLYASTHQMPLFPGTGAASETGDFNTIVNVPLKAGAAGPDFLAALRESILPRIEMFKPDLVLVSAGFDAHRRDPLAGLSLEARDYAEATRWILDTADSVCAGRVVSVLEGGYDLEGLASSCSAHVRELMAG